MTRAERLARVRELRGQGFYLREIAEREGISISYVHDLLQDPDGSKARERKRGQYGECADCGAPTAYKTGGAAKRCAPCAAEHNRYWTPETVIAAIREFVAQNGRPPTAVEWRTGGSVGDRPDTSTVQNVCGGWNAAIAAAGFDPLATGHKLSDYPQHVRDKGVALYVEGLSCAQVAKALGATPGAVHKWVAAAGVSRSRRDAQLIRLERQAA